MTDEAPTHEALIVLLTRMEGTLNLVAARVDDVVPRVVRAEGTISDLVLGLQRLTDRANSSEATATRVAASLKEAEELRRHQTDSKWSKSNTWVAVLLSVATVFIAVLAYAALNAK